MLELKRVTTAMQTLTQVMEFDYANAQIQIGYNSGLYHHRMYYY